jgi:hypothetical protein
VLAGDLLKYELLLRIYFFITDQIDLQSRLGVENFTGF